MPASTYHFPFGQPVKDVKQKDRSPKHTFVLGVYASAVHAEWKDAKGKTLVKALAVASEPEIFWNGENAGTIIGRIKLPPELGTLTPASAHLNGPSAVALDEMILAPLKLTRADVWLCDLVPQSRLNPSQDKAIKRAYQPLVDKGLLPAATVPPVAEIDELRRKAILRELKQSGATRIILLGDEPIRQFLKPFVPGWSNLATFVKKHGYGSIVKVAIEGTEYDVLPLAHPRQIAKLGLSSPMWAKEHQDWLATLK